MRRQLFVSHGLVIVVALAALAVVLGVINQLGLGREAGVGRRGGGPSAFLIAVAAAAIASGLVSWWTSRRLATPISRIGQATRQLAAGRYNVVVPSAGVRELDSLAADVSSLAHELDTTERRRLRLIGDVAHELRNPLSTIQGTMEGLLDGVVTADDGTYARIGREAARLRRLADDLSSLSAAGELSTTTAKESVDMAGLLADVVAQLEPQAEAKGLNVVAVLPEQLLVRGHADRLTQVMVNVVGNAIQYTEQGRVSVSAACDEGVAQIEVADTGRGLAPGDEVAIFERFHRVDPGFAEGTGVGLAIARLIVNAHGGTIAARSPGVNQGTTVAITVPAVEP